MKLYKLIAFLLACALSVNISHATNYADTVFLNGKVYTVNDTSAWAEAVAVKGKHIAYVGANQGARALIGKDTKVIELDGKMLLPGFIDSHAHPVKAAGYDGCLVLDLNDSVETWVTAVADYAKANPDKPGIFGYGFLAAKFGSNGPTKELLDEIVPDRPVVIMDEGSHSAWFNSKAFELAGIDKNTPDPVPGTHYYQRDAEGNPTGWGLEAMTFFPVIAELGLVSKDTMLAGAERTFGFFSSLGITTIYDAGFSQLDYHALEALDALAKSNRLPFRVVASRMIQDSAHVDDAIEILRGYQARYSSELVQPRVMKIHNDGTKEARTAAQFVPYIGQPDNLGSVLLGSKALEDFVIAIDQAGFDIHIHAIGDWAVDEALDAFAAARKANPDSKNRYSIAHTELVRDQDLPRFGELDVVAQTTPYWFHSGDGSFEVTLVGRERTDKLYRFRKILETGGTLSFGSDFPSTGGIAGVSPWVNIEMGMTRRDYGDPESVVSEPAEDLLTLAEMIRGYTMGAAYQLNMETQIGSLEKGKLADLIVLDKNLFETDVYDIHKAQVELTMMNGKIVFERSEATKALEQSLDFPQFD